MKPQRQRSVSSRSNSRARSMSGKAESGRLLAESHKEYGTNVNSNEQSSLQLFQSLILPAKILFAVFLLFFLVQVVLEFTDHTNHTLNVALGFVGLFITAMGVIIFHILQQKLNDTKLAVVNPVTPIPTPVAPPTVPVTPPPATQQAGNVVVEMPAIKEPFKHAQKAVEMDEKETQTEKTTESLTFYQQISDLQKKLNKREEALTRKNTELSDLRSAMNTLEQREKEALEKESVANAKVITVETELRSQEAHAEAAQVLVKEMKETQELLHGAIATNEDEIRHLKYVERRKQEKVDKLSGLVADKQSMVEKLKQENAVLESSVQSKSAKIRELNRTHQQNLGEMSRELSKKQSEALARSGAAEIDSAFPTAQEITKKFESIRDKEHAELHGHLTRILKQKIKKWTPLYATQYCHKLLFKLLTDSYASVVAYREEIYGTVGETLQIDSVVAGGGDKSGDAGEEKTEENASTEKSKREKLEYVFHFYLQSNCDTLIQSKKDALFVDISSKNEESLEFIKSLKVRFASTKSDESGDDAEEVMNRFMALLREYIDRCVELCWQMVLCQPQLTLYPTTFEAEPNTAFDEKLHKKLRGSDRNPERVLYHAWPSIQRHGKQLNLHIHVMARTEAIPQMRKGPKRHDQQS